ncbi:Cupredoxin [Lactarius sanguifluus]|nr:Cupredoxin [Lactarius sanguifluus]
MRFTITSAALAAIAAATSAVAQTNIQVQVGSNGLTFSPSSVNASVGDTVSFVFFPKNHTVTQSSFAAPCQPLASGIDSSFQPVAAGATTAPSFSVTVNATTPLWFYCRQSSHCTSGMVFAINPTADKSFETFQATARASSADGTPPSASSSPSGSTASSTGTGSSSTSTSSPNSAITYQRTRRRSPRGTRFGRRHLTIGLFCVFLPRGDTLLPLRISSFFLFFFWLFASYCDGIVGSHLPPLVWYFIDSWAM